MTGKTKAELLDMIGEYQQTIEQMSAALDVARRDMADAEGELDRILHRQGDLNIWPCPNSPGEPYCITSDDDDPHGFSVNLYVRDTLVGVEVYSKVAGERVAVAGLVPAEEAA